MASANADSVFKALDMDNRRYSLQNYPTRAVVRKTAGAHTADGSRILLPLGGSIDCMVGVFKP